MLKPNKDVSRGRKEGKKVQNYEVERNLIAGNQRPLL